jgi:diguanylate cyclase (GGDEF)-like protein
VTNVLAGSGIGPTFGTLVPAPTITPEALAPLLGPSGSGLQALVQDFPVRGAEPGATSDRSATQLALGGRSTQPTARVSQPNAIERLDRVIPAGVWIALAAALMLAAVAGAATLLTSRRARYQAARLAAVSEQALTDPLTGVLNRRGFIDAAERELARARRYGRPVALAFVDVRGLKAVNDSEGHRAGDELLRHAASLLLGSARADDVVGRIGGDELAVLLGEQSAEGAATMAARIQSQVPAFRDVLKLRERWDLTVGTAAYPADGASFEELLSAADRRLYEQRGIELR